MGKPALESYMYTFNPYIYIYIFIYIYIYIYHISVMHIQWCSEDPAARELLQVAPRRQVRGVLRAWCPGGVFLCRAP